MRHAFLIIAHERPEALRHMVGELDSTEADIFVHIDKKAPFDGSGLKTTDSRLHILPRRIDGRWGDYSLVEIEFELLRTAVESGPYDYYHLISGVDIPLKTPGQISEFCRRHPGAEYIAIARNAPQKEIAWRSQHRFLFPGHFKSNNLIIRTLRRLWAGAQSAAGYRRYPLPVVKGSQWWSVTDCFARYALDKEAEISHYFKGTYCPDEMVFQTLAWNSPFRSRLFDSADEFSGNRRWIRWVDGALIPLTASMIEEARKSDRWFTRKRPEKFIS